MLRRFSTSHLLIRLVVVMLVVALASQSVYADVASTTDDPAGYVTVDGGTVDRSLTFTTAGFPAGSSINDVNIAIRFIKTDGSCAIPAGGTPFDDEIFFRLTSPGGTSVTLIAYGTFAENSASAGVVTMTFDGAASVVPAGAPATGTFLPTGPGGMNDFNGEDPLGTWTLTAGDDAGTDPLCYDWSTLTIDADAPSPNLALGKSVDVADPVPGQGITYSVVVYNSGAGDATNAVVSDTLPSGLTFAGPVNLDPPGAGTTGTPPTLVSGLTITAGERITLTFPVTVNTGLAAGTMITNTASVTSTKVTTPLESSVRSTVQNAAPVADDDPLVVQEDSSDNALDVLDGDSDANGDALSIDTVGVTDQGGTALNGGSVVTYTPASNFFGTEVFTYTVSDGNDGYATATVTVTVQNQNDPPTAEDDAYATPFETALVVLTATGVLTNDLDLDGDLLTATLGFGPGHGSLDLHPDGSFVYTPTASFFGVDAFTYHANDGLVDSNVATATITVLAPTEVDLALSKGVNEAVPGEGETIVYSLRVTNNGLIAATGVAVSETLPAGVIFVGDDSGGTLVGGMWTVGTLSAGASATLRITATVDVGTGGTAITNTATIAAVHQNDPFPNNDSAEAAIRVNSAPTISDIPDQRIHIGMALGPLSFTIGDHETDADNLWLWASSSNTTLVPTSAIVLGGSGTSRSVSVSPAAGQTGTATIRITVNDGELSAADNFVLTVEWYTYFLPLAKR